MKRSPAPHPARSLPRAVCELVLLPVHLYRRTISPLIPNRCKYYPSCSAYAVEAVRELGPIRGVIVAGWRLARCNPWSLGGVDELADRRLFRDARACSHPDHGERGATV